MESPVLLAVGTPGFGTSIALVNAGTDSRRGDDYVWVVRMDDAANASELEAALRDHVTALATVADPLDRPEDVAYRVLWVDEETLALAVGDSVFVETVSVSGDGGTVNVSAGTAQETGEGQRTLSCRPTTVVETHRDVAIRGESLPLRFR